MGATPPTSRPGRVAALVTIATATLAMTASCAPRGVAIPPGADALEPCESRGPIEVELLADRGAPGCDMEGLVLVYPDGRELEIAAVGVASGSSGSDAVGEIQLVNWGVPGVGAAHVIDDKAQVWGSTGEAVDLQRQQLALDGIQPEDVTSQNRH